MFYNSNEEYLNSTKTTFIYHRSMLHCTLCCYFILSLSLSLSLFLFCFCFYFQFLKGLMIMISAVLAVTDFTKEKYEECQWICNLLQEWEKTKKGVKYETVALLAYCCFPVIFTLKIVIIGSFLLQEIIIKRER